MHESIAICPLEDYGTLRFCGAEAAQFLQGQLSQDVSRLTAGSMLRAGLHNPQGRTLALLWLIGLTADDILAILPREVLAGVLSQLRRYVLRSKLKISDETAHYRLFGLAASGMTTTGLATTDGSVTPLVTGGARALVSYDRNRFLLVQDAVQRAPQAIPGTQIAAMSREQWRALDIAAGLPQVYAATAGQFVAQMLNLDCIDAISFTKGCYTGQEVIARAHYRGRVKRRLQRFESHAAVLLAPGDAGRLEDGRSFRVVEARQRADGRCEFLAVAALPGTAPEVAHEPEATPEAQQSEGAAAANALAFTALALPYPLPD